MNIVKLNLGCLFVYEVHDDLMVLMPMYFFIVTIFSTGINWLI